MPLPILAGFKLAQGVGKIGKVLSAGWSLAKKGSDWIQSNKNLGKRKESSSNCIEINVGNGACARNFFKTVKIDIFFLVFSFFDYPRYFPSEIFI